MGSISQSGKRAYWGLLPNGWFLIVNNSTTRGACLYHVRPNVIDKRWSALRLNVGESHSKLLGEDYTTRWTAARACLINAGRPDIDICFETVDVSRVDVETRHETVSASLCPALMWGEMDSLSAEDRVHVRGLLDAWAHDGWTVFGIHGTHDFAPDTGDRLCQVQLGRYVRS